VRIYLTTSLADTKRLALVPLPSFKQPMGVYIGKSAEFFLHLRYYSKRIQRPNSK
jgi:hypothetical protein